jgi:putative two-component system response regulator
LENHPLILIADDNEVNINLIQAQLQNQGYRIETANDGQETLEKIYRLMPDLILLDIMMPKVDGYEVCRQAKSDIRTLFIPIVILTALSDIQDKIKALELGADDFITKPFNKLELRTRVKSLLRMKQLRDELEHSTDVIGAMITALEAKDTYTRGHSERVSALAVRLGERVGLDGIAQKKLQRAGLLHDIGKIGVHETILQKQEKLTKEEAEQMRQHAELGHKILQPLKSMAPILQIVRSYHERCDGKGYPDGLKQEQIPLEARVLAIVDTYDSMTSTRPYREGITPAEAVKKMQETVGTGQFDDELLHKFLAMIREDL